MSHVRYEFTVVCRNKSLYNIKYTHRLVYYYPIALLSLTVLIWVFSVFCFYTCVFCLTRQTPIVADMKKNNNNHTLYRFFPLPFLK